MLSVVSVCPIPLRIAQINQIICCYWTRQPRRGEGLQTGVSPPCIRCPIQGSPERAKDLSCLQHSFYWLQYKRGLSSPPVFSPAFQASARSIRIIHLLLITQVSHLLNLMDIKGFLGILRDIWGRYLCQNGIGPKKHTSLKIP